MTLAIITLVNNSRMSYTTTGVMSRGMSRVPCTRTFPGHFPSQAPLPSRFAPARLAPQRDARWQVVAVTCSLQRRENKGIA